MGWNLTKLFHWSILIFRFFSKFCKICLMSRQRFECNFNQLVEKIRILRKSIFIFIHISEGPKTSAAKTKVSSFFGNSCFLLCINFSPDFLNFLFCFWSIESCREFGRESWALAPKPEIPNCVFLSYLFIFTICLLDDTISPSSMSRYLFQILFLIIENSKNLNMNVWAMLMKQASLISLSIPFFSIVCR